MRPELPCGHIAVLLSDVHAWLTAPVARSVEADWMEAQARPWTQINRLAYAGNTCPIVVAGDFGDRWNWTAELINWWIANVPHVYGIPGQHDLPNHRLDDVKRSGYWTLVEAGKVTHLRAGNPVQCGNVTLHGFPFGTEVKPLKKSKASSTLIVDLAVCHRYLWRTGRGHPGARKEDHVKAFAEKHLRGYEAAVVGDNHLGFNWKKVFVPGTLVRRKMDERELKPTVGLLQQDGSVTPWELDCSADRFLDAPMMTKGEGLDLDDFLAELTELGDAALNFRDALLRAMRERRTDGLVKELILKALEGNK